MAPKKREYATIDRNTKGFTNRLLFFTPTRGTVRMEWVISRMGQMIPCNWSQVHMTEFLNPYMPIEYQLADAQNIMAKMVIEHDYEWVLFVEDDNMLPQDALLRFNEYMIEGKVPIVSGLYFTKSVPPEPLIYRGRGNGHFDGFKLGDKVWADGVPFGALLVHGSLIKAAWEESPEYIVKGQTTRRVFLQPQDFKYDPEKGGMSASSGTTDLEWCRRLIQDGIFKKAGWDEYDKKKYPFLVDTNIFVTHIDQNGNQFPLSLPDKYAPGKNYKGKEIK